jgi:hypothetical protein
LDLHLNRIADFASSNATIAMAAKSPVFAGKLPWLTPVYFGRVRAHPVDIDEGSLSAADGQALPLAPGIRGELLS